MRRLVVIISVLALVLVACGDDVGDGGAVTTLPNSPSSTTTDTTAPGSGTTTSTTPTQTTQPVGERFVQIYLVQDGAYAKAVTRAVPGTLDVAANAVRALIDGPTASEAEAGLSTAIPQDTLLLGIDISDGVATVDLSQEFEQGGGTFGMTSRLAQVVYTLTQFDSVDEVVFWIDGELVTVFSGEGILLEEPVGRSDYESALPLSAPAARWTQSELPSLEGVPLEEQRRVVLVTSDDVLNVRSGAGVDNEIVGMLEPGAVIRITDEGRTVGTSTWFEIATPDGVGWVNARFLGAVVSDAAFAGDPKVLALLQQMAEIMADDGDLTSVVSSRGLYVAHNAPPIHFDTDQLAILMTDATTYKWGSAALEPGSPEIPSRTFAEAIGDRFVSTFVDDDVSLMRDTVELGGNGNIAEYAIPFEFEGFHFVSVYDPGDEARYEGLDWTAWYVSIDYEDGEPRVVGMTLNEWAP